MAKHLKLGVSGDAGSFSEEAALMYAKKVGTDVSLDYLLDMEGVLHAVVAGRVDVGIFPVVNFSSGLVKMAFEAMGRHSFTMIDEVWLDVHQCLVVLPGTSKHQIKKIVSHAQALMQCENFLQKEFHTANLVLWQDTAKAAKDLASGELDQFCAVVASKRTANIYGLDVLSDEIQNVSPNFTVFIVVKK